MLSHLYRHLIILLACLAVVVAGAPARDLHAQAADPDLTQTVALDDAVTFRIPETWIALDDQGQITLATDPAVIEVVGQSRPVPAGELFAVVFGGPLLAVFDLPPGDTVALAQTMAAQLSGDPSLAAAPVEALVTGGREAARITWDFVEGQAPLDAGVIVVALSDEDHVVFWYVANSADFGPYSQTMAAIAATLETGLLAPEQTPEPPPAPLTLRDLTQRVTVEGGTLLVSLPADWAALDDDGQLFIGSSQAALASLTEPGVLLPPGGMAAIVLEGPLALGLRVGDTPEDLTAALALDFLASLEPEALSDVFSFSVSIGDGGDGGDGDASLSGAFQVWGYTLGGESYSQGVLALQLTPGDYVAFVFTVRSTDPAPYVAALQTVAGAALRLDAPVPTPYPSATPPR